MRVSALLAGLAETDDVAGAIDVSGLSADSRKIAPGELFVALTGTKGDGARFVGDAIVRGAAAIVAGRAADIGEATVPVIRVDEPRRVLAIAAARLHQPAPGVIAAVTGTSGKTSVAAFLRQIWVHGGLKAASVGTIGIVTPDYETYGSLTTPDPVDLAKSLQKLASEHVTHVAIEASSHGLDQHRLDGLQLAAAAFTNLSLDHLDYHPTFEAYFDAKMRLFEALLEPGQPAVIDVDTYYGQEAARRARLRGLDVRTVGVRGRDFSITNIALDGFAQVVTVATASGSREIRLPLLGTFQVSNALIAAGLAHATGVELDTALGALETLQGAPGRLELVGTTATGGPVFIDYSHKPDALEKAIQALRPFTQGRLVVVFGCGGDRDAGKRPIMGAISARLADVTIVTDDNPRSEVPAEIRRQILVSAPDALEIGDRAEAIRHGVKMLQAGDILMIAGKGHETGQIIGDRVLPFSDRQEAIAAIEETRI
jgi:UDP-N-acetylmuramoyl-L-alanyl-D-glutamate--2,6-diaminopimelate ligase